MRKFILKILAFSLPLFSCLLIADYILAEEIKQSNERMIESWYDLMHSKIDADIVVMGSSRAWVQINPLILDSVLGVKTYNLGIDGSSANRQIHKYNLYRKYNRKPQIILQNIDIWAMGNGTGYEREQLFPYFWDRNVRKEFFDSEPYTVWEKYLPMFRFRDFRPLEKEPKCLIKGYQGQDKHWDGTKFEKIKEIAFYANDTTAKMFDDYLAQAKADGIKVILFYAPQYIGATKKTTNQKFMHEWYQQIANKYNYPILDYTYMHICYDTTYFYNAMHLNRKGAEIFSDSLANDLKRLKVTEFALMKQTQ